MESWKRTKVPRRLRMELWKVFRTVIADLHHVDEALDQIRNKMYRMVRFVSSCGKMLILIRTNAPIMNTEYIGVLIQFKNEKKARRRTLR
jgi:hypothetical protein